MDPLGIVRATFGEEAKGLAWMTALLAVVSSFLASPLGASNGIDALCGAALSLVTLCSYNCLKRGLLVKIEDVFEKTLKESTKEPCRLFFSLYAAQSYAECAKTFKEILAKVVPSPKRLEEEIREKMRGPRNPSEVFFLLCFVLCPLFASSFSLAALSELSKRWVSFLGAVGAALSLYTLISVLKDFTGGLKSFIKRQDVVEIPEMLKSLFKKVNVLPVLYWWVIATMLLSYIESKVSSVSREFVCHSTSEDTLESVETVLKNVCDTEELRLNCDDKELYHPSYGKIESRALFLNASVEGRKAHGCLVLVSLRDKDERRLLKAFIFAIGDKTLSQMLLYAVQLTVQSKCCRNPLEALFVPSPERARDRGSRRRRD